MGRRNTRVWGLLIGLIASTSLSGQDRKVPEVDLEKQPSLYVVGYSHLDTQWRWTYVDTIREYIPNTLRENFKLFEKYPSYVFNFSGSRRYEMMMEYYPDDYAKLKEYVAAGRWFPCGSSVDENDANGPSAESLVRHVLYGNRFFRREFGIASDEFMLPDCFGFPAAMPSVLAHCGIKGFSTQKLTWNAVVPIPFKVGVWEGPDGRGVIAALDPGAYVGEVLENLATSNGWQKRIEANGKQSGVFVDYHYYGAGDQGGAPTDRSVALVEESVGTKGPLKVISGPADWMFKAITPEMRAALPRYKGELMLTEHSAGSVTSQAYMKRWNRKNELLADAAEKAAVAAAWLGRGGGWEYPVRKLESAWSLVLGSQMHDILPGTSVPKAYEYSWNDEVLAGNQFGAVLEDAAAAVMSQMDTRGKGIPVVVYNPLSWEREDVVEVGLPRAQLYEQLGKLGQAPQGVTIHGPDGKPVPVQVTGMGGERVAFLAKVPPLCFAVFDVEFTKDRQPEAPSTLRVEEPSLENERYRVTVNDDGNVASIYDKKHGRELLKSPARLGLHYENPAQWPAWNQDWADRQLPAKACVGGPANIQSHTENGPVFVSIVIERECEGSKFTQIIKLYGGEASDRIEFHNRIDWRTRERSLRAEFPLAVSNPKATYDVGLGTLERGNGHPKQYEYPFHQWFDLTDAKGDYGVSILCDSKYGSDKPDDNTVRLTLLHTPGVRGGYPDQATQDIGHHEVTYAIVGHAGDWRSGNTAQHAAQLNQPLIPFVLASRKTEAEAEAEAMAGMESLAANAISPSESGTSDQSRARQEAVASDPPGFPGPLGKSFSLLRVSDPNVSVAALKKAEDSDEIIVRLREHSGNPAKGVRVSAAGPITAAREVDGQEREIAPAAVQNGALTADLGGYELRAFAIKLGDAPARVAKVDSTALPLPFNRDVVSTNAKRSDGAFDTKDRSLPAEQLPAAIVAEGVTFTLGSGAEGQKNAVACEGQELKLPDGGYDRLYLLAAADTDVETDIAIDGKPVGITVPAWSGYIGQWDNRIWPGNTSDPKYAWADEPIGLEPGYIKQTPVAWYCSHHHTPAGDALYEYSYLFKIPVALPPGAKTLRLPQQPGVNILAASVAKTGNLRATPAEPLFDTMAGHAQDAPRIVPPSGEFTDATVVTIEPGLYWRPESIRYKFLKKSEEQDSFEFDEPGPHWPAYTGPITINEPVTILATVLNANGRGGPPAWAEIEVNDRTAPSVRSVSATFQTPLVRVDFSEPVDAATAIPANFVFDPALSVTAIELSPDRRSAALKLSAAPETGRPYRLQLKGVQDCAPTANVMPPAALDVAVRGPVYTLDEVTPAHMGTEIRDVPGLPVKAGDAWTLNMWIRANQQPENRTLIAGFGRTKDLTAGAARYLSKFGSGIQFWSHNADLPGRTPLDLNRWQMLTTTYDGKTLRLYKDGKLLGERPVTLADDENVVKFAPLDPWEGQRRFTGEIRDFTIWDSALREEAIASLVSSAKASE